VYAALTRAQCLGVHSPANDAPVELISCYDRSAALDWVFSYPGDNASLRLNNTNLCAFRFLGRPPC
jgi:hypothetical protein